MASGERVDVRQATAVAQLVSTFHPDVIIHTVGSNRPDDMTAVIEEGTQHIVWAAEQEGARLIHISTDALFDGQSPPYDENAQPTPMTEYGRAKARAEAIVSQYANHVIVRTSLIYGLHHMDHGTAWMSKALAEGKPVKLFNNQIRNPVWVETLSRACLELAENAYVGILNVAGRQALTRAEFALRLLDWWHIQTRATLTIGPGEGNWPLDCRLNVARATAVLQTPLLGVDEVLEREAKN